MRLILLRHGIAEDRRPDLDDAERRLTPAGIERTRMAVRGLAAYLGAIDAILTSPKRRAQETAELLSEVVGTPVELCEPLSEGTISQVLGGLKGRGEDQTVVMVGHEPQLSMTAERLCGVGAASCIELKKAGAVVLRLGRLNPDTPTAVLEALLPPRVLRTITPGT